MSLDLDVNIYRRNIILICTAFLVYHFGDGAPLETVSLGVIGIELKDPVVLNYLAFVILGYAAIRFMQHQIDYNWRTQDVVLNYQSSHPLYALFISATEGMRTAPVNDTPQGHHLRCWIRPNTPLGKVFDPSPPENQASVSMEWTIERNGRIVLVQRSRLQHKGATACILVFGWIISLYRNPEILAYSVAWVMLGVTLGIYGILRPLIS